MTYLKTAGFGSVMWVGRPDEEPFDPDWAVKIEEPEPPLLYRWVAHARTQREVLRRCPLRLEPPPGSWPAGDATETRVVQARGWPFLALYCFYTPDTNLPLLAALTPHIRRDDGEESGAWMRGAIWYQGIWFHVLEWAPRFMYWSAGYDAVLLPCVPMPVGFTLNSLLYAVLWRGLVWAPCRGLARVRRRRRARRGRCPRCNYDLQGNLPAGCPECGWGRPE